MIQSRTSIRHAEFTQMVRKYSSTSLIEEIGRIPRHYLDPGGDFELVRQLPPWVVAGIVRESFVFSNPHRRLKQLSQSVILDLSNKYQNIYHPNLDAGELLVARITTRLALEQFSHQESDFEELARYLAIYDDGGNSEALIIKQTFEKSLGMSVRDFANLAMITYAISQFNHGIIPLDIFSNPNVADYLSGFDEEVYALFLNRISIDQSGFRQFDARFPLLVNEDSVKYRPNPLMHFPVLRLSDSKYLAPLPRLILRRSTHVRIFQDCFDVGGKTYSSAVGRAFENYLGRQLELLRNAKVYKERKWKDRNGESASVDWIVVTDSHVLLVECKSTKLPDIASTAEDAIFQNVSSLLTKSLDQIDSTYENIVGGNPVFSDIPRNLAFVGLLATAENMYIANSPIIRKHAYCQVPFITMSFREIEHCVPGDGQELIANLLNIASDPEKKFWQVNAALPKDVATERNPILDEYADKLEVFEGVKNRKI